jgi:hypothetical protein
MTAHDLAKEWLRYAIENAAELFEFCNKVIRGIILSVDSGDESESKKLVDGV